MDLHNIILCLLKLKILKIFKLKLRIGDAKDVIFQECVLRILCVCA